MWKGKRKAVTFSFDDGVEQDIHLIDILSKYGLKATFNLNSGLLGVRGKLTVKGKEVRHDKILPTWVDKVYRGYEIGVHTLTHPNLTEQPEETIIRQVEEDRKALEDLCGYSIVGMAYPSGGVNNDERVAEIIRRNTKLRYARTITSTHNFKKQDDLYRFNPTVYILEKDLYKIVDNFLNAEEKSLLYIWGHSYELDSDFFTWADFEKLCKTVSKRDEIFYGTNSEVLLGQ